MRSQTGTHCSLTSTQGGGLAPALQGGTAAWSLWQHAYVLLRDAPGCREQAL